MIYTEPTRPTADGKFKAKAFIVEGAEEMQDWVGFLPQTEDLPTTHEHYVVHRKETRNDRVLTIIEVEVREKAKPANSAIVIGDPPATATSGSIAASLPVESDNLNALGSDQLEVAAAVAGAPFDPAAPPARNVAEIRRAKKK
jgi:hypothetical protein